MSTSSAPPSSFDKAAKYLASSTTLSKVSNDIKLELYGLFKYVTVAPNPTSSRPGLLDFAGRAKWDAWASAGKKYQDARDAQERYLVLAKQLGWTEDAMPELSAPPSAEGKKSSDDGDIWDSDSDADTGGKGGLGITVSMMSAPKVDENEPVTIHSLALANDINGLEAFVNTNSDTDINERDEFGYTPLHLAADRGHVAMVRFLLTKGADQTLKDDDDFTPLELANVSGHVDVEEALKENADV